MKFSELEHNLLIQKGRELYKVSNIDSFTGESGSFTAQLLLVSNDTPPRTRVRRFDISELTSFVHPSDIMVRRYESHYGNPAAPGGPYAPVSAQSDPVEPVLTPRAVPPVLPESYAVGLSEALRQAWAAGYAEGQSWNEGMHPDEKDVNPYA